MNIAFLLYDGMTALDFIGPHEVLSRIDGAHVSRVAGSKGRVETDSGVILAAETGIDEVSSADILVVPGAASIESALRPEILEWVRAVHQTTQWTTSVCTGALILGAAGILNGKRATTHWAAMNELGRLGAIPEQQRIVEDGKIITCAGVSAGIDFALALAAHAAGQIAAEAIQLTIEYDPQPPFDAGNPSKAGKDLIALSLRGLQAVIERRNLDARGPLGV